MNEFDLEGLKQFLDESEEFRQYLLTTASHGVDYAKSIAPHLTGDYERGLKADAGISETGHMVGRIAATDWKSNWVEKGSVHNQAHHVLDRTIDYLKE